MSSEEDGGIFAVFRGGSLYTSIRFTIYKGLFSSFYIKESWSRNDNLSSDIISNV